MPQAEIFGEYILLERISHGGMAEIFAAKKQDSPKIFVIKRILPAMASDEAFIKMFTDEATIAGELSHLNICQIYELGCIRDMHFISMEYVWGKDVLQLQARLRRLSRRMLPELLVYIGIEVCKGLEYAHRKTDDSGQSLEIIHRDVSPQNILVSYDGDIRLIDFGIASAKHRSSKTQAGVIKGKFGYMAPEQVRGKKLDQRADIFSLGITLWEMATSKRLFVADNDFAVLDMVKRSKIVKPSTLNPEIPDALEHIIMKALTRDRDKRYTWASELGEDLLRSMNDRNVMTADQTGHLLRDIFAQERRRERRALEIYRDSKFDEVGNTASRDFAGNFTLIPKSVETSPDHIVEDATLGDNINPSRWETADRVSDTQHGNTQHHNSIGGDTRDVVSKPANVQTSEADILTTVSGSKAAGNQAGDSDKERFYENLVPNRVHVAEAIGDIGFREDTQVSVVASLSKQAPPVEKQVGAFPGSLPQRIFGASYKWIWIPFCALFAGLLFWTVWSQMIIHKHSQSALVLVLNTSRAGVLSVGKVSLDGKESGDVSTAQPLVIDSIDPGKHAISIASTAGKSSFFRKNIQFRSWKTEVITVNIDHRTIDLSQPQTPAAVQGISKSGHRIFNVTVFPKDAQVVVDGKLVDSGFQIQTGIYKIPISPGAECRLVVTREHYKPIEKHLSAKSVGEESLTVRLEMEARQTLRIRSNPKSAQVFVDGILSGRTPVQIKKLRYGHHLVSIAKSGYRTWRKDIHVDWGNTIKSVDVRLKRSGRK